MPTTTDKINDMMDDKWGFMTPDVTRDNNILLVETMNGTECVPGDVIGLPTPPSMEDDEACQEYAAQVSDYCEAGIVDVESACLSHSGYVCRLSASGYTDCTPWVYCKTEEDVLRWMQSERQAIEV